MPFAHDGRGTLLFQLAGEGRHAGVEIAPGVFRVGADDAGHAGVGVAPGEQCRADGEQTVQLARIVVSSIPSAAMRSMLGVRTSDSWYAETSP